MTEIAFYHLQRQRLEEALPLLLEKSHRTGKRALVLCGSAERVKALDSILWTYRKEAFLPHAARDGDRPADQPILLTDREENANASVFLFTVDGAGSTGFVAGFERVFDLFDGNDPVAVEAARERWRIAKAAGHPLTYWQQDDGGWQKKAVG